MPPERADGGVGGGDPLNDRAVGRGGPQSFPVRTQLEPHNNHISGVQWSTVEYSGVQWSTVKYSGVQWSSAAAAAQQTHQWSTVSCSSRTAQRPRRWSTWSTVEYSGAQLQQPHNNHISGVQWNTVEYSGVQCCTVEYSGVQWSSAAAAAQRTHQWSTVEYSGIQCSTVQYSGIQCGRVQYSAVLRMIRGDAIGPQP
eukprot:7361164-Pyramimonas_sp.AAC.2